MLIFIDFINLFRRVRKAQGTGGENFQGKKNAGQKRIGIERKCGFLQIENVCFLSQNTV